MSESNLIARRPVTGSASYSFYLPASDGGLIERCASVADAVTIAGPAGPDAIRRMRATGFTGCVLFDREGYRHQPGEIDQRTWIAEQRSVEADRVLTAGCWAPWIRNERSALADAVRDEVCVAQHEGAIALVAVDARWLMHEGDFTCEQFCHPGSPVALVLSATGDPLSDPRAVSALRTLAASVSDLSVLRSDQGAFGAVAFGCNHAAVGLTAGRRHFVPPGGRAFAKRSDWTGRVFVRPFYDWFTASTIAGWSISNRAQLRCSLACCNGRELSDFLDEDLRSALLAHNLTTLASVADEILNAPQEDRSSVFLEICRRAAECYDLFGFHGPQHPKAQLTGWLFS